MASEHCDTIVTMPSPKMKCGLCKCDPVRKGRVCCSTHNLIVCSGCKGTDRFIAMHNERLRVSESSDTLEA